LAIGETGMPGISSRLRGAENVCILLEVTGNSKAS